MLQPITYHFPHYNDLSERNREKNREEREQWWQIFQSFQKLLKRTAKTAIERKQITLQQAHKYFSSGMCGNKNLFNLSDIPCLISIIHLMSVPEGNS